MVGIEKLVYAVCLWHKKTLYHTAAPEVEAVTKLFVRLLHNGYIKSKYKRDIVAVFCEKTEKVNSILKCFLDDEAISRTTP